MNSTNRYYIRLAGESLETALDSVVGSFDNMEEAIKYAHDELPDGAEFSLYDADFKIEVYSAEVTGKFKATIAGHEICNGSSGLLLVQ